MNRIDIGFTTPTHLITDKENVAPRVQKVKDVSHKMQVDATDCSNSGSKGLCLRQVERKGFVSPKTGCRESINLKITDIKLPQLSEEEQEKIADEARTRRANKQQKILDPLDSSLFFKPIKKISHFCNNTRERKVFFSL